MNRPSARVGADEFDLKYRSDPDPWSYHSSSFEQAKYARTLAAIADAAPFGRALELGCSIGVFTKMLAPHCRELHAVDFSAQALALAEEHLRSLENVQLERASFPEEIPPGHWDLIVCSEVLYYLDEDALVPAIAWLMEQLQHGATIIVVSWRGEGKTEPLRGDQVHDLLEAALSPWHSLDGRRITYRLNRFDGDGD